MPKSKDKSSKKEKTKHSKKSKKESKKESPKESHKKSPKVEKSSKKEKPAKEDIQLVDPAKFDSKRVIFNSPKEEKIPGEDFSGYRINIKYKYDDGSVGPIIFEGTRGYSYGVAVNINKKTEKVTGHSVCINLFSKDEIKPEEQAYFDAVQALFELCMDHLVTVKKKIRKPTLKRATLDGRDGGTFTCPLYFRKDKETEELDESVCRIYPKIMEALKDGRVFTKFYDEETEDQLKVFDFEDKHMHITHAVKWESIWIGTKFSLQPKLTEGYVKLAQGGGKKLLNKPKVQVASKYKKGKSMDDELGSGDDEPDNDKKNKNKKNDDEESDDEPDDVEKNDESDSGNESDSGDESGSGDESELDLD